MIKYWIAYTLSDINSVPTQSPQCNPNCMGALPNRSQYYTYCVMLLLRTILRCNIYLFSKYFSVSNGVKQGGVLSPILFSIYINKLLLKLKESGYGCHLNGILWERLLMHMT